MKLLVENLLVSLAAWQSRKQILFPVDVQVAMRQVDEEIQRLNHPPDKTRQGMHQRRPKQIMWKD